MIGVLLRLQALSMRGRVVRSLRLMRQPKYLVGSLAGALWMIVWVGRPLLRTRAPLHAVGLALVPAAWLPTAHLGVAIAVTIAIVVPWLWPWGRSGLRLREAELTFLLQAPLTRRQVIGYGLLRAGIGTVVSSAVLSWVLGQGIAGRLILFAAILPFFTLWGLNGKWRSMFLLEQQEHPRAVLRRLVLTVAGGGYLVAVLLLAARFAPRLLDGGTPQAPPPILKALLLPGWLLTAPIFATGAGPVLLAAVPIALLALVQLELVLRSHAPFEEASLEWAKQHELRQTAGRRTVRLPGTLSRGWHVFELRSAGRAEVAVLWKNLMRISRFPLRYGFTVVAGLLVLVVAVAWVVPIYPAIYGSILAFGLITAGTAPLFAGMSWYNDLRSELTHLELVRTWPVAPFRFVLAEVCSPALLSTLLGLTGLGVALAGYAGAQISSHNGALLKVLPEPGTLGVSTTTLLLLACASFVPLLAGASFATAAVQNLAALFVPAWMVHTADAQRGIAAIGRNLIVGTALFFGFSLALVPSALLVGLALLIQHWAGIPWSAWAFPLWGLLAAAPLFVLGGMLVVAAGNLWSALDPSAELLDLGR